MFGTHQLFPSEILLVGYARRRKSQLLFSYRATCGELRKTEIECCTFERALKECNINNLLDIKRIEKRIYGLKQTINDYFFIR